VNSDILDVMVPAYGDGPLLREALESVLGQDDPRWRLTVLDDAAERGSRDLANWIEGLADERVCYLPNERRLGINRNFQRCVDEAKADLVAILGADDRLLPDFVGRVHNLAGRYPAAAWFHTGATIIDGEGKPSLPFVDRMKRLPVPRIDGVRVMGGEDLAVTLLHGNWMYFPSCVFRREPLVRQGFREGYDIVLDLDLFLRILIDDGLAVLSERPGIEYRRHAASLSSSGAGDGTRFAEEAAYFAMMSAELEAKGWRRAARAARLHWTSRLHGLAKLPSLLAGREFAAAAQVLRLAATPGGNRVVTTGGTR
jgi:glycosyltransferase involved in cell wall biosynthesis